MIGITSDTTLHGHLREIFAFGTEYAEVWLDAKGRVKVLRSDEWLCVWLAKRLGRRSFQLLYQNPACVDARGHERLWRSWGNGVNRLGGRSPQRDGASTATLWKQGTRPQPRIAWERYDTLSETGSVWLFDTINGNTAGILGRAAARLVQSSLRSKEAG